MTCPTCGADHHLENAEVAELEAAAAIEVAETHAEAETAHAEQVTERNADDNDTAERIAEIQAEAAVAIAEAEADAAVAIAEAETDAVIAIADAESSDDDDKEDGGDGALESEDGELEGTEPEAVVIAVPPQVDDEPGPAARAERARRSVSAFRARRPR